LDFSTALVKLVTLVVATVVSFTAVVYSVVLTVCTPVAVFQLVVAVAKAPAAAALSGTDKEELAIAASLAVLAVS